MNVNAADFVYQTPQVFVIMAREQHLGSRLTVLIIPKQHVQPIYDISAELLAHLAQVSQLIATSMHQLWPFAVIIIWQHNEAAGYQDVWHYHIHIQGRLPNDQLYQAKKVTMTEIER